MWCDGIFSLQCVLIEFTVSNLSVICINIYYQKSIKLVLKPIEAVISSHRLFVVENLVLNFSIKLSFQVYNFLLVILEQ